MGESEILLYGYSNLIRFGLLKLICVCVHACLSICVRTQTFSMKKIIIKLIENACVPYRRLHLLQLMVNKGMWINIETTQWELT